VRTEKGTSRRTTFWSGSRGLMGVLEGYLCEI